MATSFPCHCSRLVIVNSLALSLFSAFRWQLTCPAIVLVLPVATSLSCHCSRLAIGNRLALALAPVLPNHWRQACSGIDNSLAAPLTTVLPCHCSRLAVDNNLALPLFSDCQRQPTSLMILLYAIISSLILPSSILPSPILPHLVSYNLPLALILRKSFLNMQYLYGILTQCFFYFQVNSQDGSRMLQVSRTKR